MTRLIVVRHGESVGNCDGYFTGNVDIELTDLGRRQALMVRDFLKDYHIDKVCSSDLSRAYETALPIAEQRGLTVEKIPDIREINGGVWEKMVYADIKAAYPVEYDTWLTDMGNASCVGGESVVELAARVDRAIKNIVAENDGKTVCIVCHGTPIRALACIWRGVDIHNMQSVPWVANASVSIAEYGSPDAAPDIILYGHTDHLKDCVTMLPDTV